MFNAMTTNTIRFNLNGRTMTILTGSRIEVKILEDGTLVGSLNEYTFDISTSEFVKLTGNRSLLTH